MRSSVLHQTAFVLLMLLSALSNLNGAHALDVPRLERMRKESGLCTSLLEVRRHAPSFEGYPEEKVRKDFALAIEKRKSELAEKKLALGTKLLELSRFRRQGVQALFGQSPEHKKFEAEIARETAKAAEFEQIVHSLERSRDLQARAAAIELPENALKEDRLLLDWIHLWAKLQLFQSVAWEENITQPMSYLTHGRSELEHAVDVFQYESRRHQLMPEMLKAIASGDFFDALIEKHLNKALGKQNKLRLSEFSATYGVPFEQVIQDFAVLTQALKQFKVEAGDDEITSLIQIYYARNADSNLVAATLQDIAEYHSEFNPSLPLVARELLPALESIGWEYELSQASLVNKFTRLKSEYLEKYDEVLSDEIAIVLLRVQEFRQTHHLPGSEYSRNTSVFEFLKVKSMLTADKSKDNLLLGALLLNAANELRILDSPLVTIYRGYWNEFKKSGKFNTLTDSQILSAAVVGHLSGLYEKQLIRNLLVLGYGSNPEVTFDFALTALAVNADPKTPLVAPLSLFDLFPSVQVEKAN